MRIEQKSNILARSAMVFGGAFFIAFMASSVFAPTSLSNADTLHFNFSASGYTTSVQSASTVSIDLETFPTATTATASDTVTTITNNPDGYKLYVFMDRSTDYSEDNPGNALYKDGDTTSSTFIPATAGTLDNPTALSMNTWGLSLDNGTSYGAVPLKSDPYMVASSSSATPSGGDTLNVKYGVSANMNLKSGTYTGNVVYEVIPDATTGSFDTSAVYPATAEPGETLTIVTDLYTSTALASSDITVTVGEGAESYACTVNEVSTAAGNLVITCTLPADAADGEDLPLTVTVTPFSKTYDMTVTVKTPLPLFYQIATMQEMTPEVCASVYAPSASEVSTNKSSLNIIDKAHASNYTATADGTNQIPETTLLDDRDADGTGTKKSYTVRKLADGNCWMTDNLAYDLLGLYNNSKRGIGSKNDGSTFEITDSSFASGVSGYYTSSNNTYNYVINGNTKPLSGITRYSYSGDISGNTEYYYNWTGATAGQGSQTQTSGDIDGSICPAGWRLPTSNKTSGATDWEVSWNNLTNAYLGFTGNTSTNTGYQTLDSYPISLYRAGAVYSGSQLVAQYGYYWSSSAYPSNSNYAYYLAYDTSFVYPQDSSSKYYGFQVRCLAAR
ncbi:hypothetical protein IKF40_00275 [Candidatus Saccharibacteria bacterium]|nr:hypothetical protein [Candidatus Saccharibacteria bacterium]